MSKSHVSLGQHQCPVCLTVFDSGEILLDRRLKETLEPKTITGHSLCPTCQSRKDEGFVALIEFKGEPTGQNAKNSDPRTGRYAHVKGPAFRAIFNQEPPEGMIGAVPEGFIEKLAKHMENQDG